MLTFGRKLPIEGGRDAFATCRRGRRPIAIGSKFDRTAGSFVIAARRNGAQRLAPANRAAELTPRGISTPRGGQWHPQTVTGPDRSPNHESCGFRLPTLPPLFKVARPTRRPMFTASAAQSACPVGRLAPKGRLGAPRCAQGRNRGSELRSLWTGYA
jgi:hypothetical protein